MGRIEASSLTLYTRGLKDALNALRDLDKENDGLFVREGRQWRKAGTGKRRRLGGAKKKPKRVS